MKNTWTIVGVVLIVILLLLLIGSVGMMGFASFGGFGRGMMGGYGMMGGIGLLGGLLRGGLSLLLLVGIVLLVVWFARKASHMPMGTSQSPLDILKARYAKGEVTKEQFDAMKKDLEA